jgi:uncharacterized protein YecE (DUF72 family)
MVRYIGHPDVPRNNQLLDEWAERIVAWVAEGSQVFFFMHCPVEARSPELCRALQQRLNGQSGIPPLPWDTGDSGDDAGSTGELTQATLF